MTQTWLAEEVVGGDRQTYEPVFCLACSQQHLISAATGVALGDRAEAETTKRGPTFPPKQAGKGEGGAGSFRSAQPDTAPHNHE
jgi:hypothetical protein